LFKEIAAEFSEKNNNQRFRRFKEQFTNRNVTQDSGNIDYFWKGSRWFLSQSLRTFCYFIRTESRKCLFGKLHLCPSI